MPTFFIRDTIESNLKSASLDICLNLEVQGVAVLKQLPNGEILEHLGYFHKLAKELRLPYEPLLAKFKEHRLKLIKKKNGE